MPDIEIIHSTSDVRDALLFALDAGFQVREDVPQPEPRQLLLDAAAAEKATGGVFFLTRPEWIFGPPQYLVISGGYNRGKYDVSPRVNSSPITLYFSGERLDQGRRRFGSAVLSFHRDWLEMPSKTVRPTPKDVQVWYRRIASQILSSRKIVAGVHRYVLAKERRQ